MPTFSPQGAQSESTRRARNRKSVHSQSQTKIKSLIIGANATSYCAFCHCRCFARFFTLQLDSRQIENKKSFEGEFVTVTHLEKYENGINLRKIINK